jgi:Na+/melibiose symporter-like transporter
VLVSYGVGEIAVTISMVIFGLFVLFFYTSVMQLPATLAGIGTAAGLLWDAVVDPYIGYRSDNQKGRLGRRHGYMLVGALLTGATFWLLLSPPRSLGTGGLFAWLLGTTLLFRSAGAVFRIPYLSLGAELSHDYHERTSIVGFRSFFGLLGTMAAATLSFVVFFPNQAPGVDPKLDYAGYPRMGLFFGLAMTVAGLWSVAGTFGRRHGAARGPGSRDRHFAAEFRSAWRTPAFRRVWLAFTLFFFGVVVNAALAIHYFTWYVRIDDSAVLSRVQLCFYVGALAGVVPWVRLARRAEKRSACLVALVATALLMSLATLLFGEGRLFGTGRALPLLLGHLLAGAFASALWVLPGSMLADVADEDELRGGQRREGLFFGLMNFGEKVAAGAALLLAGVLLDVFVGLVPGHAPTADAVSRIGLLYGVLPALVLGGAALSTAGYGLDRRTVTSIQSVLRGQGEARPAPAEVTLGPVVGAPAGAPSGQVS